jgi:hypothetical protein
MKTHIIAIALALASMGASAGDWHAPKQSPDNFSDWDKHFVFVGFLPGLIVGTAKPDWHPATQFAVCSIPGLIHEFEPSKGNVWSGRDLLVNSIGCGLGLWASTGFRVGTTPTGGVRVTYSVALP